MLSLTWRAAGFGLTERLQNQLASCLDAGFPHNFPAAAKQVSSSRSISSDLHLGRPHLFRILNPDKSPSSALPSLGIPGHVMIILMNLSPSVSGVAKQSFWWINHFSEGIFFFSPSQNNSEKGSRNGISVAERPY